ncbi:MAG: ATP-binding protein, partial [Candidatus Omnitrophica bacterium]|nr:ATP-binding protein [Candidatus Omnitrophota bacterium]
EKMLLFKGKKLNEASLYEYLEKLVFRTKIDLAGYDVLKEYLGYIGKYSKMDKSGCWKELEDISRDLLYSKCPDSESRKIAELGEKMVKLKKYFDLAFTPGDYREYRTGVAAFSSAAWREAFGKALVAKAGVDLPRGLSHLDEYLKLFEGFYEVSFERDRAFIENLEFSPNGTAVLMTGGFHAENLKEVVESAGYGYVSVMPNFRSPEGYGSPYFRILSGGKSPVEEELEAGMNAMQVVSLLNELGVEVMSEKGRELLAMGVDVISRMFEKKETIPAAFRVKSQGGAIKYFLAGIGTDGIPYFRLSDSADGYALEMAGTNVVTYSTEPEELKTIFRRVIGEPGTPAQNSGRMTDYGDAQDMDLATFLALLHSAKGGDISTEKDALANMVASGKIKEYFGDVKQEQVALFKNKIRKVRQHQFSGINRPIVEIIANSIDAYSAGTVPSARDVDVRLDSQGFEVVDRGKGMSLYQVITDLMIPSRSSKRTPGESTIGRFGVGFYSVLNYLKTEDDRLVVETSNGLEGTSAVFHLVMENGKGVVKVSVTKTDNRVKGTTVRFEKKDSDFDPAESGDVINDFMRFNQGAVIKVNGGMINDMSLSDPGLFARYEGDGGGVHYSREKAENGEGEIFLTVNGVVIKKIAVEGRNIPKITVFDLPKDTALKKARDRILCGEKEKAFLQDLWGQAMAGEDGLEVLNVFYEVVAELQKTASSSEIRLEGDFIKDLKKCFGDKGIQVLPDTKDMSIVSADANVFRINQRLFGVLSDFVAGLERYWEVNSDKEILVADFKDKDRIFAAYGNLVVINREYIPKNDIERAVLKVRLQLDDISADFLAPASEEAGEDTAEGASKSADKRGMGPRVTDGEINPESEPLLCYLGENLGREIGQNFEALGLIRSKDDVWAQADKSYLRNALDQYRGRLYLDSGGVAMEIAAKYPAFMEQIRKECASGVAPGMPGTELTPENVMRAFRRIVNPLDSGVKQFLAENIPKVTADAGNAGVFFADMIIVCLLPEDNSLASYILHDAELEKEVGGVIKAMRDKGYSDGDIQFFLTGAISGSLSAVVHGEKEERNRERRGECVDHVSSQLKYYVRVLNNFPGKNMIDFKALQKLERKVMRSEKDFWREAREAKIGRSGIGKVKIGLSFDFEDRGDGNEYLYLYLLALEHTAGFLGTLEYDGLGSSGIPEAIMAVVRDKTGELESGKITVKYFLEFIDLYRRLLLDSRDRDIFAGSPGKELSDNAFMERMRILSEKFVYIFHGGMNSSGIDTINLYEIYQSGMESFHRLPVLELFAEISDDKNAEKYLRDFLSIFGTGNRAFAKLDFMKKIVFFRFMLEHLRSAEYRPEAALRPAKGNYEKLYQDPQTMYEFVAQEFLTLDGIANISEKHPLVRPYLYYLSEDGKALEFLTDGIKNDALRSEFADRREFDLSRLVAAYMSGDASGIDPMGFIGDVVGKQEADIPYNGHAMDSARNSLVESINYESADDYVFIREMIQNGLDAKSGAFRVLGSREGDRLNMDFIDETGMTPEEVVNFLLIPDNTGKENMKDAVGQFGQGFFTILRESESVFLKTAKGDKLTLIEFTPVRVGALITDVKIKISVQDNTGSFKGTSIRWSKISNMPEIEAGILKSRTLTYGGCVDPSQMRILWGEGDSAINKEKYKLVSEEIEGIGTLSIFDSPSRENAFTQKGLYIKDIDHHLRDIMPKFIFDTLIASGVTIDIPEKIALVSDRADIADKDEVLEKLRPRLMDLCLKALIKKFAEGKAGLSILPYDFLSNSKSWMLLPNGEEKYILDDAARIMSGELIDYSRYNGDERALGKLILNMPFVVVKDKMMSFAMIFVALSVNALELDDLEEKIRPIFRRMLEKNGIGAATDGAGEIASGSIQLKDTKMSLFGKREEFDTYWAFIEFVEGLSDLLLDHFPDKRKPSTPFGYYWGDEGVAHCFQETGEISWNLASGKTQSAVEIFSGYLKGEKVDIEAMLHILLFVQTHETVHALERTQDWTHDPTFFEEWKKMADFLIRDPGKVRELLDKVKGRYSGTYIPAADFGKFLNETAPDKLPGIDTPISGTDTATVDKTIGEGLIGNVVGDKPGSVHFGKRLTSGFSVKVSGDIVEFRHEGLRAPVEVRISAKKGMAGSVAKAIEMASSAKSTFLTDKEKDVLKGLKGRKIVLLKDDREIKGGFGRLGGEDAVFLSESLASESEHGYLALIHELGEGGVFRPESMIDNSFLDIKGADTGIEELKDETRPLSDIIKDVSGTGILSGFAHTFMRGVGEKVREAYREFSVKVGTEQISSMSCVEFIKGLEASLKRVNSSNKLTAAEKTLIYLNFGKKGSFAARAAETGMDLNAMMLEGFQGRLDMAGNLAFTAKIKKLDDELRKGCQNYLLLPGYNLELDQDASRLGRKVAREYTEKGTGTTINFFDGTNLEERVANIAKNITKDMAKGASSMAFIVCLSSDEKKRVAGELERYPDIKGRVIIVNHSEDVPDADKSNLLIDVPSLERAGTHLLNYKRLTEDFKLDPESDEMREYSKGILSSFAQRVISGITDDEVSRMKSSELARYMSKLLEGDTPINATGIWRDIESHLESMEQVAVSL